MKKLMLALMCVLLVAGCTSDAVFESMGYNVLNVSNDKFDGKRVISLSHGMVYGAESGWVSPTIYLAGDWYVDAPSYITITAEVPIVASVQGLDANVDGVMKSYDSLDKFTQTGSDATGGTLSSKRFAIPVADIKSWIDAQKVVLRVDTDKGAIIGYFAASTAKGQPIAKEGMKKMLAAIAQQGQPQH